MKTPSLHNFLERFGAERRLDFGLERFKSALKALGNPESVVHTLVIGGTNGKGTTTLLVSSALERAGHRVVTYLSPHLQDPTERILDGLLPMDPTVASELAAELCPVAEKHALTYFEFLTLMVTVFAKRVGADFLVLEVGLGGRLDATNVTHPLGAAITNISFDHQAYLGNTLEAILNEKLGIVRPEGLLFTGIEDPRLLDLVEKRCLELDAVYYFSREIAAKQEALSWDGQSITLNGYPFELANPSPGTVKNAALAFLMMRILFPKLPMELLQQAFRRVRNPGRLEVVNERPRVVLSGDHNPAGIADLATTLKSLGSPKIRTVCGFSPDKPYTQMYQSLSALSEEILLTQVTRLKDEMPRDYSTLGPFVEDPKAAVEQMMAKASPEDTILVTGSLYLIGEVRSLWRPRVEYVVDAPASR